MSVAILFKHREPCTHKGCSHHVKHPCEYCGRIAAQGEVQVNISSYDKWNKFNERIQRTVKT